MKWQNLNSVLYWTEASGWKLMVFPFFFSKNYCFAILKRVRK